MEWINSRRGKENEKTLTLQLIIPSPSIVQQTNIHTTHTRTRSVLGTVSARSKYMCVVLCIAPFLCLVYAVCMCVGEWASFIVDPFAPLKCSPTQCERVCVLQWCCSCNGIFHTISIPSKTSRWFVLLLCFHFVLLLVHSFVYLFLLSCIRFVRLDQFSIRYDGSRTCTADRNIKCACIGECMTEITAFDVVLLKMKNWI